MKSNRAATNVDFSQCLAKAVCDFLNEKFVAYCARETLFDEFGLGVAAGGVWPGAGFSG